MNTPLTSSSVQVSSCKEQVNSLSEELALRIHCYNETQLSANHKLMAVGGDKQVCGERGMINRCREEGVINRCVGRKG